MTNLFEALLDCRLLFADVVKGSLHLNYKNNVVLVVVISNHADVQRDFCLKKKHTYTHGHFINKHSSVMICSGIVSIHYTGLSTGLTVGFIFRRMKSLLMNFSVLWEQNILFILIVKGWRHRSQSLGPSDELQLQQWWPTNQTGVCQQNKTFEHIFSAKTRLFSAVNTDTCWEFS